MPREEAVRRMLEKTKKFEVQLHEFLGKDYEGADLDRSPYPEVGSLVADDGTFLLYRLTGSPLFHSLKSRIASIAEIADDVFADTPGKATFDWICQAVSWIESLHSAVTRDDLQVGEFIDSRLVIPGAVARKLLLEGEAILLDVPEDLRKTLIQHRIFVSTNQGGNLTVKTTKGGAHHAAGVTVIRWCPFLFDSLKADVSRLDEWDNRIRKVSADFISFNEKVKLPFCLHTTASNTSSRIFSLRVLTWLLPLQMILSMRHEHLFATLILTYRNILVAKLLGNLQR
jgi:hypothetical protein